ncbi:hypothetical protein HMI55_001310 [Coelomomyces lativittatus]|nr:hypothetical protein HMI55_001310 [Coelomomyces lativittatus]
MNYPKPRSGFKNGAPGKYSNIASIDSEDLLVAKGQSRKTFPCGNTQPNPDRFKLEKGKNLRAEFYVNNNHDGGTCQFSISYDNSKTFVAFHQIVNDCFAAVKSPSNTTIDVPIPNDLPGGNAVFAWTWITKKSNQPEYYMGCSDVTIDGPTVGKVTGFPLIVSSIEFRDEYLRIYSADSSHAFLFQKKPELVMSVEGNKIEMNNKLFTPTRHLKKNDPLFAEFRKTTSSTTNNKPPNVETMGQTPHDKTQDEGTLNGGSWSNISPHQIDTNLKYSYNMGDRPKKAS